MKKDYQKPTMRVIKMQHRTHLLDASGVKASRSSYGVATTDTWGEEGG